MAANSKIEWTDNTFNPWWGCARVSDGCRFCYADTTARRYGHNVWRRHGARRLLSEQNWRRPTRWNREAEETGVPLRVFCASMADVFEDHPQLGEPRQRLWEVIEATPWLRWQLLTKRPENVARMAPWSGRWPSHVWLGVSVEDQQRAAERIPILLSIPAPVRFLSCEPLLEEVDLTPWLNPWNRAVDHSRRNPTHVLGPYGDDPPEIDCSCGWDAAEGIHWVIVGGESGPKARPTELQWIRSLVGQCQAQPSNQVSVFVKQLGTAWARSQVVDGRSLSAHGDRQGGRWDHWPQDLRIRQSPDLTPAAGGAR